MIAFLKVILVLLVAFRVFVAIAMEPAFLFDWPLALEGCASKCVGKQYADYCVKSCELRSKIKIDLADYIKMDQVLAESFGKTSFNILMVELIAVITPLLVVVSLGLFTSSAFFRKLGLFVGGIMFQCMIIYIVQVFMTLPQAVAVQIAAYNAADLLIPVLLFIIGMSSSGAAVAKSATKAKRN